MLIIVSRTYNKNNPSLKKVSGCHQRAEVPARKKIENVVTLSSLLAGYSIEQKGIR